MARAIFLTRHGSGDRAFEIREISVPAPGETEARVRVHSSGINFADVLARIGLYPEAPPLPCVLGYEVAGVVEEVGPNVQDLRVGDRVLGFTRFGGYASELVLPVTQLAKLPDSMPFGVATALGTQGATAWLAARHFVNLVAGDRVLIHAAAGGVGSLLAQIALRDGCTVFGTASSEKKLQYLRSIGVQYPIHSLQEDFTHVVRGHCGDEGLDVVFDSIGGSTLRKGLALLGAGGRMVSFGVAEMASRRKSLLKAASTMVGFGWIHPIQLLSASKAYIGINALRIADHRPELLRRGMAEALRLAEAGVLKPRLDREFPAESVGEAHEEIGARKTIGKVALQWT